MLSPEWACLFVGVTEVMHKRLNGFSGNQMGGNHYVLALIQIKGRSHNFHISIDVIL